MKQTSTDAFLFRLVTHLLLGLIAWLAIEMYGEMKSLKENQIRMEKKIIHLEDIFGLKVDED